MIAGKALTTPKGESRGANSKTRPQDGQNLDFEPGRDAWAAPPICRILSGHEVGKELTEDEKAAFNLYTEKFGECRDGSNPGRPGPGSLGEQTKGKICNSQILV